MNINIHSLFLVDSKMGLLKVEHEEFVTLNIVFDFVIKFAEMFTFKFPLQFFSDVEKMIH